MKTGKRRLISVAVGIAFASISSQTVISSALAEQEKNDEPALAFRMLETAETQLPLNLSIPDCMKPALCKMLDRSPTFRRQCREIDQSRRLRIVIKLVADIPWPRCRALSTVKRYRDGRLVITTMIVAARNDYVEMIAHEFEHAVEQIEGLDLRKLAFAEGGRVYRTEDGIFETKRAIEAGLIVASEFRSFREQTPRKIR